MLAEREERERKDLRKRIRERNQLADGDAIISEEEDEEEQEQLSDWSAEESEEAENSDNVVSDFNVTANDNGGNLKMPQTPGQSAAGGRSMGKRAFSKASDLADQAMRFNALRFLAMNLKSQNESLNK